MPRLLLPAGLLASLCACCALEGGCSQSSAPAATGALRITDDRGRVVALSQPAQRIASLSPALSEMLFALGCGEQLVLRDRSSDFPPAARALPATNPFQISAEHLASYRPDLILLSHAEPRELRALAAVGLPAAVLDPRSLEQLYRSLAAVGVLCGREQAAATLAAALKARAGRVQQRVAGQPRPRVYIETDGSDPLKPWIAGPGSLVDQLLTLAGGENFASGIGRPFAQLSAEEILVGQPEVILLMNVERAQPGHGLERLRSRPGWSLLPAIQQGRVIESIHADLLSRAGPRLLDGLERLAQALHPGAFTR